MAILEMRLLPDPILRKQATKVAKVTPQLKTLVGDMVETMRDQRGVGLAANQVGSLQKVAVIETPGYRGLVNRSETVRVKAMGLDGKTYRLNADDLLAQALEHEIDHLNGILYIDHLVSHESLYKVTYHDHDDEFDDDAESLVDAEPSAAANDD